MTNIDKSQNIATDAAFDEEHRAIERRPIEERAGQLAGIRASIIGNKEAIGNLTKYLLENSTSFELAKVDPETKLDYMTQFLLTYTAPREDFLDFEPEGQLENRIRDITGIPEGQELPANAKELAREILTTTMTNQATVAADELRESGGNKIKAEAALEKFAKFVVDPSIPDGKIGVSYNFTA